MNELLNMNETSAVGIVKITDLTTGELLVHQKNAIHFGNISWAITKALEGSDDGHITHMVFGSGGTSIDSSGNISYRSPNTSNLQDPSAEPYQPTYWEALTETGNSIATIDGTSNFSDLVTTVVIGFGQPDDSAPQFTQDAEDTASTTNDVYVFDELALYTGVGTSSLNPFAFTPGADRMLTHVIFHPVQKAANREIEIEYTIRVQMG